MIQKPIRLGWLDRFAYDHFRRRFGLHWIWGRFFARKHALADWQEVITFSILWDKTIGCNESQLTTLVASWLYKTLEYWHPDGFDAALDLILDTIRMRLGWWAAYHGPSVVPEYFPRILEAAEEYARECAQSDEYMTGRLFKAGVHAKLIQTQA